MMTRGQLADATGCHIETIRYYEKIGLLPEPSRNHAGYRIYHDEHLRRLGFIQKARALGFSADQTKELLEISDNENHTRAEVKHLTENHINAVSNKIKDLKKLQKRLKEISSHCDGSSKPANTCPILTTLFDDG